MSFSRPEFLHLFWILPVVAALYLVKRPPRRVRVPHLFLWERVLRNRGRTHATRVREWFSLLLQLMIATLLVMAAAAPEWTSDVNRPRRVVFVVDRSSAADALRVEGGSRSDEAWRILVQEIAALGPEDQFAVYSGAAEFAVERDFATSGAAEPLNRRMSARLETFSLVRFTQLVKELTDHTPQVEVVYIGPGAFAGQMPDSVKVILSGEAAANDGLVGIRVVDEGGDLRATLRVFRSHSDRARVIKLQSDRGVLTSTDLPAGPGVFDVELEAAHGGAEQLQFVLDLPGDAFAGDDVIEIRRGPESKAPVLVVTSELDVRLRDALSLLDMEIDATNSRVVNPADWRRAVKDGDLVILDRVTEKEELPSGCYLLLDSYAPGLPFAVKGLQRDVQVTRATDHPAILRGIDLRNLGLKTARILNPEGELTVFLEGSSGGLISFHGGPVRFVHVAFDVRPGNSSFQLLPAWPLFLKDSIHLLRPARTRILPLFAPAGGEVFVSMPERGLLTLTDSSGVEVNALRGDTPGTLVLPRRLEQFTFEFPGSTEFLATSVLSEELSDLRTRVVQGGPPIVRAPETIHQSMSLVPFILALLICLVLLEWMFFSFGWTS